MKLSIKRIPSKAFVNGGILLLFLLLALIGKSSSLSQYISQAPINKEQVGAERVEQLQDKSGDTLLNHAVISTSKVSLSKDSPKKMLGISEDTEEQAEADSTQILGVKDKKNRREYLVTRVIDGDTIEIETGQIVRYIGINTPEITKGKNECYGQAAFSKNKQLVLDKKITLEKDVSETDKYGRLLRYIWVGEVMVNELLIKHGYAQVMTYPPDVARSDNFIKLEQRARELNLGLWNECPTTQSDSRYGESVPQADTYNCPSDKPIKGNAQSMIYHLPSGEYYYKTKPEECFSSEREAISAGFRKSKR